MRVAHESTALFRQAIKVLRPFMAWTMVWFVAALAVPAATLAATAATDGLLEQRVHDFLAERIQHLGDDVTITLHRGSARLPECQQPEAFLPNFGQRLYGRVSVGVRCGEQRRVRYLQADISVMTQHVVVARDIAANARIAAADLKLEEARLERLPRHAILDVDAAVGLLAVRPLPAGTTLQDYHLRREPLVERGDSVTVYARGNGFTVSLDAEALDNGALGDEVRLRTDDGDRLQARVVGRDKLEIVF
ncbi:flagella basal body P-ring formation protein FlgA [Modicisalibacter muralis]|uniref:Flagella basal body P-ring formation protein FlgA n=1 Tax=Modicisalibacter muralis TaxID=119000 RepID=A0A1G9FSI0_9GAMM|nr:flagellar basal body P-ring formation chaperone FlgA [Halomonas muralis]SDK91371.1 flagella basal body P-ring formation protein FlgA [Halomonas muralis]